ncbi:MAG TPA: GMC family oxidoreductase [Gemmatimonadaceae bacterium]|nr:GMC family oxidoreductase [Gemmatimonadaceae bacterium]
MNQRTFTERETVDFVIVGSGAAGGVLAKELSSQGFDVVVLEQGPWQQSAQFTHDELAVERQLAMLNRAFEPNQTFRTSADEPPRVNAARGLLYRRAVGGSSVHFAANYWRFRPIDFKERSEVGEIGGTGFADWPITYEELEPYYTKVDWEIGVSGAPGPFDPPRSRPYPMPPLPNKSGGVLLERAAHVLGLHAQVSPMAILSQPRDGRSACMACGHCSYYGCEFGAKSSSLVTVIPKAIATGRCEVRTESTAFRVETNDKGRATGILYFDKEGKERRQPARAVVLAANGAEDARLLLMSTSPAFPHGLANSSGNVGRFIMFNGYAYTSGRFEHPLNEYKGAVASRVVLDYYDADPKRGFYGGGGIDARFPYGPIAFAVDGLPRDVPQWGREYKQALSDFYSRSLRFMSHLTSLPVATNTITLDAEHADHWGRPGFCLTYKDHPDDMKTKEWFRARSHEMMVAAGATHVWDQPVAPADGGVHLLGTARMGNDPRDSVVDRYHRAHDVPNLFICDGSSFVTSGRGQPTMTIQALAFRAADHITRFARSHAI